MSGSAGSSIAEALFDGYDADTGIYEQFAGFGRLEPLVIEELAPRRPIAADLLLGAERTQGAQVIKQADVLMLHHLVPDEVVAGSLEPNLRFYEPRTAHGSSLSPAIHASLAGPGARLRPLLEALRIAARMDLDDLTGSTAQGLHLATMGGVWQALAFGFAGLRPRAGMLHIDPVLPPSWSALELRVRFHGARVRVRKERAHLSIWADRRIVRRRRRDTVCPGAGHAGVSSTRTSMGAQLMKRVIAAIDNSAAARPVLTMARAVASALGGRDGGPPCHRGRR